MSLKERATPTKRSSKKGEETLHLLLKGYIKRQKKRKPLKRASLMKKYLDKVKENYGSTIEMLTTVKKR